MVVYRLVPLFKKWILNYLCISYLFFMPAIPTIVPLVVIISQILVNVLTSNANEVNDFL